MASWFRRAGAEILRVLSRASDPAAAAGEVQVYSKSAELYARNASGDLYQYTPYISSNVVPSAGHRTLLLQHSLGAGNGLLRLYASTAGNGAFEATINAEWNSGTSEWDRDVNAKAAKFTFGDADAGWHVKAAAATSFGDAAWDGKTEHALSDSVDITQDVAGAWTAPGEIDGYAAQQCPKASAGANTNIASQCSFKKDFPSAASSFTFTKHAEANLSGNLTSYQPKTYGVGVYSATDGGTAGGTTCYFYARVQAS